MIAKSTTRSMINGPGLFDGDLSDTDSDHDLEPKKGQKVDIVPLLRSDKMVARCLHSFPTEAGQKR